MTSTRPLITMTCTTQGMAGFYGLWLGASGEVLASGTDGLLVRSPDAGATWTRLSADKKRWSFGGVARLPSGEIVVAGGGGRIPESSDDGSTWSVHQLRHKDPMHQIASSAGLVVAAGCNRVAWRASGQGWLEARMPAGASSRGACIAANGNVFVSCSNGRLFRLEPALARLELVAHWKVRAMHAPMADGDTLVVVGSEGFVAVSRDGGATWTAPRPATPHDLTGGSLIGGTLVVGTTKGAVLRSQDLGASWIMHAEPGSGPARVHRLVANAEGLCLAVCEEGVFRGQLPSP